MEEREDTGKKYLSESQKRSAVRVDVSQPVEVWLCRLTRCDPIEGRFVNLSGSGALVEVNRQLPVGLRLHLRFTLTGPTWHSVDASVVRSLVIPGGGHVFKMALHFDYQLEGKRDMVIAWIFEELVRQRRLKDVAEAAPRPPA